MVNWCGTSLPDMGKWIQTSKAAAHSPHTCHQWEHLLHKVQWSRTAPFQKASLPQWEWLAASLLEVLFGDSCYSCCSRLSQCLLQWGSNSSAEASRGLHECLNGSLQWQLRDTCEAGEEYPPLPQRSSVSLRPSCLMLVCVLNMKEDNNVMNVLFLHEHEHALITFQVEFLRVRKELQRSACFTVPQQPSLNHHIRLLELVLPIVISCIIPMAFESFRPLPRMKNGDDFFDVHMWKDSV